MQSKLIVNNIMKKLRIASILLSIPLWLILILNFIGIYLIFDFIVHIAWFLAPLLTALFLILSCTKNKKLWKKVISVVMAVILVSLPFFFIAITLSFPYRIEISYSPSGKNKIYVSAQFIDFKEAFPIRWGIFALEKESVVGSNHNFGVTWIDDNRAIIKAESGEQDEVEILF